MDTVGDAPDSGPAHYQRALRAGEARLRTIIERNADGMLVVGRDGVIRLANPAARALLAREEEGALVGEVFGIPIIPGETTEVDIPTPGGGARVAEMRIVETEWDGEPVYLASLRDITDRKRLEEELRRRAQELADADRRKDEFLAMLAHELRNPLAPILVAMRVLRLRHDDRPTQERMLEMVERQVTKMARLIDDLLDVSRIRRGKVRLRKERVELATVVDRAIEVCRPLFGEHRLSFSASLPTEPVPLVVDPVRLEQVLVNLLHNAAKYTDPGGSIGLTAACVADRVELRVRDDGIGMTPEFLGRVFDLFAQADGSLDRSRGGLGIGLTLVRDLVAMHGGSVLAESDGPGLGSEFIVRLPVMTGSPCGEPAAAAPETAGTAARPLRILVVDDNASAAESLTILLGLWGHDALVAHDGPTAIDRALEYRPQVVLLDIGLPGIDGYEVARRLRKQPAMKDALLVATSGYGSDDDRRRCWDAGFDHHLVKPVDLDVLENLLSEPGRSASDAGDPGRRGGRPGAA